MKTMIPHQYLLGAVLLMLLTICACTRFKDHSLIYDPTTTGITDPVITGVNPPGIAGAGVREVTIDGTGFSTDGDSVQLFFNNEAALFKSISLTRLVAYRPVISGDSIRITVVVPAARGLAKLSTVYRIETPLAPLSAQDIRYASASFPLNAMEVDRAENLFVSSRRVIYKITPAGTIETYKSFSTSDYATITDMKFGPDGPLYFAAAKTRIFRLASSTANPETLVTVPRQVDRMDFDQNGNIYAGAKNGLYVIHSNRSVTATGRYAADFAIREIRVFQGFVYLAATYTGSGALPTTAIWKNEITDAAGTLGENQLVCSLGSDPQFTGCVITSFTIGSEGTIYLCLQGHAGHSVFVLESDGSVTPYYNAPILPRPVDQLAWGNGKTVYLNRGISLTAVQDSTRLYAMGMATTGAPYLGR